METRSQSKTQYLNTMLEPLYEINIDFTNASACWRHNKRDIGNGHYKYICTVYYYTMN